MLNLIGLISGEGLVSALIYLICLAVCFWLIWFLIDYCAVPEPFNKVLRVIVMIAAVVVLINVMMSIAGHPLISW